MPRKTKKQKILARLHRLEHKNEEVEAISKNAPAEVKVEQPKVHLNDPEPKPTRSKVKESVYDYSYVFKDVRKIFILTILALAAEVILSLTASTGYANLVLRTLNLGF